MYTDIDVTEMLWGDEQHVTGQ